MQWSEWKAWGASIIDDPASVASVTPSGIALVEAMSKMALAGQDLKNLKVVELGPGLGTVTAGLLRHIQGHQIMALETNPRFVKLMRHTHPLVDTKIVDAQFLDLLLKDLGVDHVNVVVSSLGLRAMPSYRVEQILRSVHQSLNVGGRFVQYTYGQRPPIADGSQWKMFAKQRVVRNIPPATVYGYEKI